MITWYTKQERIKEAVREYQTAEYKNIAGISRKWLITVHSLKYEVKQIKMDHAIDSYLSNPHLPYRYHAEKFNVPIHSLYRAVNQFR